MTDRREFLAAGMASSLLLVSSEAKAQDKPAGTEHWTVKKTPTGDVKLFMWRKRLADAPRGPLLFVHGSSVQSLPAFDLQIPGEAQSSVMDWFARLGYDTWTFDCEGYGRSDKSRPVNADIACGADDIAAVTQYMKKHVSEKIMLYGPSSGRPARWGLFAQRHPREHQAHRARCAGLHRRGQPDAGRAQEAPPASTAPPTAARSTGNSCAASSRATAIPTRTIPQVVERFADQVLALDDSMPTGTYVDMSANLPILDPAKIKVPDRHPARRLGRHRYRQGRARFLRPPAQPDKQLTVMPGIAHTSLRSKNWRMVYDLVDACCSRAAPIIYRLGFRDRLARRPGATAAGSS
jgi:pimeloyl-ACP methyl ester carboxylesterase